MTRALAALVLAALAAAAPAARAESERAGSFELSTGQYRPNIDAEFARKPGPYETIFGTGRSWTFRGVLSKSLFTGFGSLDLGAGVGYFKATGNGLFLDGTASADRTSLAIVPVSALLTYRADFVAEAWGIPLVPYGRLGLERYNWWVTDGAGKTTKSGATNGWSAALGLCLLLDFFDPDLGRELDADTGINHTYVFAEAKRTKVDDFGSKKSWDLSDEKIGLSFGLLFVF